MAKSWWKWLAGALALTVLAVFGYFGASAWIFLHGVTNNDQPPPPAGAYQATPKPTEKTERINLLLMGLDDEKLRTDTLILISFDPVTHKVAALQVPRDTRARLAGRGTLEKINHAHAYGVGDPNFPGPYRSMKTVEELVGVPVHYYVQVDFDGFKKVVDLVGGVDLTVPKRMYYVDPYQNLKIDLQPGQQRLGGEQAVQFMRYRDEEGDLGRIARQQQFIKAFSERAFSVGTLLRLPYLASQASEYVETNLDAGQLLSLARDLTQVGPGDLELATLPGIDAYITEQTEDGPVRVSYYLPNREELTNLVSRLMPRQDERNGGTQE